MSCVDELARNEKKLLEDLKSLEIEEVKYDALEEKRDKVKHLLDKSRGKRKDMERRTEELCNILDMSIMFESGQIMDGAWANKGAPKMDDEGNVLDEDEIDDGASESGRLYAKDIDRIKDLKGKCMSRER